MGKPTRVRAYGQNIPLIDVFPFPIFNSGAPTASDKDFEIGQVWVYNQSPTARVVYMFGGLDSSQDAIWNLVSAGSSTLATLTGNTGGALSPSAGNINILGSGTISVSGSGSTLTISDTTGGHFITPWVVGPTGGYATIASAITAASAAGGGTIYIQPGTYSESLTLSNAVTLIGTGFQHVIITGVHTPPASGAILLQNLTLTSSTHIFSSAVAGSTTILVEDCVFNLTNGYIFNLANWTGSLSINNCSDISSINGIISNTGGSTIELSDSGLGAGTGNSLTYSGGSLNIDDVDIGCPVTIGTGATLTSHLGATFANTLTTANNSICSIDGAYFSTGSTASISHGSSGTFSLSNSTILSSNNPSISGSGAGTITLTDVAFLSNASLSGTLTLAYGAAKTGALTTTGSVVMTTAAAGNTIVLGSAAMTGTLTLGNSTAGQTISIGDAVNSGAQIITIATGASAANSTVNIMTGTLSAGAQAVNVGAVATTVAIKGTVNVNASTNANVNICTGTSTGAVAIGNSAATTMLIQSGSASTTAIALTASNAAGGITLTAGTGLVNVAGTLSLSSSATQLRVKGGAVTDFIGTGTLSSGTVTIANTNIASTDRIFIQRIAANGSTTLGELSYTISATTSFTVTSLILGTPGSTQTADTSTFSYFIVRQN